MSSLILPAQDERSVQQQLHAIDPALILTRERDHLGRDYYVVIWYEGGTVAPVVVLDWREMRSNTPKPLSSGLVYEIQKMMAAGPARMKDILRHNRDLRESKDDEMEQVLEDIAKDFDRHKRIGNFAIVPRSRGLYLSRARARRRGGA